MVRDIVLRNRENKKHDRNTPSDIPLFKLSKFLSLKFIIWVIVVCLTSDRGTKVCVPTYESSLCLTWVPIDVVLTLSYQYTHKHRYTFMALRGQGQSDIYKYIYIYVERERERKLLRAIELSNSSTERLSIINVEKCIPSSLIWLPWAFRKSVRRIRCPS